MTPDPYCCECGRMPAHLIRRNGRRLCGVCYHRAQVLHDLLARCRREIEASRKTA